MSLIVDSLKKVKKEEPDKNPYPIINVKKRKSKKLIFFLFSIPVFLLLSVFALYFLSFGEKKKENTSLDKIDYSRTALSSPTTTVPIEKENKLDEEAYSKVDISSAKKQVVLTKPIVQPSKEKSKVSIDIDKEFKSYLLEGDKAYLRGNLKKAIKMYEKAVQIKEDIPTYMVLLSLYSQVGDIKKIEKFIKYRDLYPWVDEDIVSITIKNLADSKFNGDIKVIENKAINLDKSGRVYEALGYFYEKKGNKVFALHYYKQAYKKDRKNPEMLFRFAKLLENTGNTEQAKKIYTEILHLDIEPSLERKIKLALKRLG